MHAITHLATSAIGVTGLALATLGAGGGPASAVVDTCRLTVNSVKALDLQDGDGRDETFLRLGDTRTANETYTDNQKRRNLGDDDFQGSEQVRIIERDSNSLTLIGSAGIPCVSDSGSTDVGGAGAIYRVTWSVLVVP